jgi:hypothetical protein
MIPEAIDGNRSKQASENATRREMNLTFSPTLNEFCVHKNFPSRKSTENFFTRDSNGECFAAL